MTLPRLAVLCDMPEENWPSMDLVGEMLLETLRAEHAADVRAERICPPMKRRFSRPSRLRNQLAANNADRLINRFRDYPRLLRRERRNFHLFHIVDHSYAQLVHELPAERTIVTCHDLDTFRCLLEPEREPRSKAFVRLTRKILDGLRKAAKVTCDSEATRTELLKHKVVPAERTVVIHNGVHPTCSPEPDELADKEVAQLLGPLDNDAIEVLHVGSTVERKRIDVLLHVFAAIKNEFPKGKLVRAGGEFTSEQLKTVEQLGLTENIVVLPPLTRPVLSSVYRRAALLLQPSEREGFGLPVVEAMACGTPVVASDLDVLREVGGGAAVYSPVADVRVWSDAVIALLHDRRDDPLQWETRRKECLMQSAKFTWSEYASRMVGLYRDLWGS